MNRRAFFSSVVAAVASFPLLARARRAPAAEPSTDRKAWRIVDGRASLVPWEDLAPGMVVILSEHDGEPVLGLGGAAFFRVDSVADFSEPGAPIRMTPIRCDGSTL